MSRRDRLSLERKNWNILRISILDLSINHNSKYVVGRLDRIRGYEMQDTINCNIINCNDKDLELCHNCILNEKCLSVEDALKRIK